MYAKVTHVNESSANIFQIHQVGFDHLIGPGILINMMHNGERYGADSQVTVDDILEYESRREDGKCKPDLVMILVVLW